MKEWKDNGKYPASKFAIDFREDHPDLFTRLSDDGKYLKVGKTCDDGKFQYTVKEITSKKDGRKFVLVERVRVLGDKSPEQMAHEDTNKQYADKQKHIDELAERKLALLERIASALEHLARTVDDKGNFHIAKEG